MVWNGELTEFQAETDLNMIRNCMWKRWNKNHYHRPYKINELDILLDNVEQIVTVVTAK